MLIEMLPHLKVHSQPLSCICMKYLNANMKAMWLCERGGGLGQLVQQVGHDHLRHQQRQIHEYTPEIGEHFFRL